jgi:hypothetical protein
VGFWRRLARRERPDGHPCLREPRAVHRKTHRHRRSGAVGQRRKNSHCCDECRERGEEVRAGAGAEPLGIAYDGSALWVVDSTDLETYKLYRVDPQSGSVLKSFDAPTIAPDALAWDGSRLWLVDGAESKLLQIDPSNGKVLKTLDAPGTYPTGIAHDGTALWVADADELKIFKVNPLTGKVIDSFDAPGYFPQGLAWDGKFLWHLDAATIYKLDPSDGNGLSRVRGAAGAACGFDLGWAVLMGHRRGREAAGAVWGWGVVGLQPRSCFDGSLVL